MIKDNLFSIVDVYGNVYVQGINKFYIEELYKDFKELMPDKELFIISDKMVEKLHKITE